MATGDAKTTEAVVMQHVQALLSRDLDNIVRDYSHDAVVFAPMGAFKGHESIRAFFAEALKGVLTPESMANLKVISQNIEGEYAYATWSALPVVPFGGDTFRVRDGKIVMQSFVGRPVS
jgi:ketosteroid isomerase-like protein